MISRWSRGEAAGDVQLTFIGDYRGYVVLYEYQFTIGLRLPFFPLVQSFMEVLILSQEQLLMPQIWRIFSVIDCVTFDWEAGFDLADLLYTYDLKVMHLCRYTLVTKSKKKNLVTGLRVNDRGWKSRFIFVEKESLGEVGDCMVKEWT